MVIIKVLIELFDETQIENIISGMTFKPEKIVFVGFKETMTGARKNALLSFIENRGLKMTVEFEIVGRFDYDGIVSRLNMILDKNEDCAFDLTGGKELVITAMGEVAALRGIPMFQMNVKTGELIRVKNCNELAVDTKSSMTIAECVQLNGCGIITGDENDFSWVLDGEFVQDIETMWQICRVQCGAWNRQCVTFDRFDRYGMMDETLTVCVNLDWMRQRHIEVFLDERILAALMEHKLIEDYYLSDGRLNYRYKNEQVYKCLSKAGNILELYAYLLLAEIMKEEEGYYDDLDIGVIIDWDGKIHEVQGNEPDTKNEVDIMLMRDLVPVFISCKNGEVHKEALYELDTVARKFGGKYAKKYMLTTYMHADVNVRKYIKQRAKDMGIVIIDEIELMQRDELKEALRGKIK